MSNDDIIDIKSVGEIIIDIKCLCGKLLNQYYLGFFIVSAFYLVLALVFTPS